jgi:hypothetical protein
MSAGGLSEARLGRMHDVMAGHVERGGHHPDDPARLDVPQPSGCLSRLLDLGLPGDRRLNRLGQDCPPVRLVDEHEVVQTLWTVRRSVAQSVGRFVGRKVRQPWREAWRRIRDGLSMRYPTGRNTVRQPIYGAREEATSTGPRRRPRRRDPRRARGSDAVRPRARTSRPSHTGPTSPTRTNQVPRKRPAPGLRTRSALATDFSAPTGALLPGPPGDRPLGYVGRGRAP